MSADEAPHFTTIVDFVSSVDADARMHFTQILPICDRQGLIGGEMFAIEGVKLPSNTSKSKSGTRADFARQADKLDTAVKAMRTRHREEAEPTVERGMTLCALK